MKRNLVVGGVLSLVLTVSGCGASKMSEPFKDAERGDNNDAPADVIQMPDGFNNMASKCDGTNRVYSTYHANDPYGAIAVVPDDPRCAGN